MAARIDPLVIRLHPNDNVVVARADLLTGARIESEGIAVRTHVPAGHKVATRAVAEGEPLQRYNQIIGFATQAIQIGDHVHTHNVAMRDFARDYAFAADARATDYVATPATFQGIRRAGGRAATRNYVGVLTSVNCSATVARLISDAFRGPGLGDFANVDGVVALTHGSGCGMAVQGEGMEVLRRVLGGYAKHPNFGAVLIVGLGCEANQIGGLLADQGLEVSDNLHTLVIQESGGTAKTVREGVGRIRELLPALNRVKREAVPASELCLALQCGGSAVLSETPEIYGAEHLLTRRAASRAVGEKLVGLIRWWEDYTTRNGGEMNNNPSPGNKAGGLTTILEKSLGAAAKGGTTNLVDVYKYAEPITAKGFVYMDSPGYDPVSATGQVAGGANVLCFTTGRGSVFGCKPVPSLKLATNTPLYQRMTDDMDINCGPIADGEATIAEMGEQIFAKVLATASGEKTKSEELGIGEDEFAPWQLGAVM